ncbi:MAG: hypothetical protein WDM87_01695 [Terracidiphilus sp.]
MYPRNIGRALGIGVRVAGRIAGQRIAASAQSAASAPRVDINSVRAQSAVAASGQGFEPNLKLKPPCAPQLKPAMASAKVSAVSCVPFAALAESSGLKSPAHFSCYSPPSSLSVLAKLVGHQRVSRDFAIGAAVVFLYLGVSSFWRARRR